MGDASMKANIAVALVVGTISAAISGASSVRAESLTKVKFALDWVIQGQHAPYLYTLKQGYFRDEGLDVQIDPGAGSATLERVAAGAYDIGVGDINYLIEFKGNNPEFDVKEVYIVHNDNPNCFLTLTKSGISTLADLKGKRVGSPTVSAQRKAWPILLKRMNLPADYITWVNYAPTLAEMAVVRGDIPVASGYPNNAATMMAAGAKMEDIKIIPFSSLGLEMYGNGIIVNGKFLKSNPEAVRKFLRALNRGIKETVKKPEVAIKAVLERSATLVEATELAKLKLIMPAMWTPEVKANGFGGLNTAKLQKQIDDMNQAYGLKTKPSIADLWDPSFLPPAAERAASP
jgi:NitT/TauT family transport system substrate-binding protein